MRWKYRILITLAALIALVIVIVQIVLWSSIPQNLVTNIIQDELGLRITTARLTTGWLGRTTLSNVSLALPLSEQSFLSVKTLKVKHTSLFGLLFGKSLAVQSIELDQPTITVRQDTTGQWNLAEVAQLLARAGGSQTAQDSQLAGIPKLPSVRLIDGFINVSDNQSHTASLPLSIDGAPQGRLIWKYNVVIGNSIKLLGELAPGLNWQHQITLQASNLDPLLKNWGLQSYDTDVVGRWSGRVDGGKIVGRLTLDHYTAKSVPGAGNIALAGAVEIQGNPDSITFLPRKVTLKTTNFALPNIGLTAGAVTADKNGIQANDLQLAVLGGLAVLNGKFDPSTKSTDLSARWSNLALPNHITHSGTLTASLRTPFEGHPSIKIDLTSKGRTITGGWDTEVSIGGLGQSWQSIDWDITAPTLRLNGNHPFEISQLVGHVRQRGPQIELTDLTLPERPHLVSRAAINLRDHNWYLWLDAGGSEKAADTMIPISFTVNAWGNGDRYVLQDFNLTVAEATVWAGGVYDRQIPNPVNLDVYLTQSPQLSSDTPIQGHFSGSFHISGLLFQDQTCGFTLD